MTQYAKQIKATLSGSLHMNVGKQQQLHDWTEYLSYMKKLKGKKKWYDNAL